MSPHKRRLWPSGNARPRSAPLWLGTLVTLGLIAAAGCQSGEIRTANLSTLEFRLVKSSSSYALNRDHRADMARLLDLHRSPNSTEADLNRELLRIERDSKVAGGNLFLAWQGSGEWARPSEFVVLGPPLMNCRDLAAVAPRRTRRFHGLVFLRFTNRGAARMRTITANNIGSQLAIVWKRRVVASPTIEQAIPSGRAVISNIQTVAEARTIADTIAACIPTKARTGG